jgi:hypothetical protein
MTPDLLTRIRTWMQAEVADGAGRWDPSPAEMTDEQLLDALREDLEVATDALLRELGVVAADEIDALVPHESDDEVSALRWVVQLWEVATGRDATQVLR